jgi:2-polyprenyl-3-methyl-5-hydroxy-6-metoxy-1,4-benzoquinol methylase
MAISPSVNTPIRFEAHPQYLALDSVRQDYFGVDVPTPTEFVLPQIRKDIVLEEIPFVDARRENPEWDRDVLTSRIRELGHWEYHFEFSHGLSTRMNASYNDGTIRFHRYRSKLISETVAELFGDAFTEASVIDLACHCGAFSLDAAFRGAKSVLGIELRERNLNQARFLKEYYRADNVEYRQGDVMSLDPTLKADVVYCLGLLYHVVNPIELLERCVGAARQMIVVDTICHKQPWPGFHLIRGKDTRSALEGARSCEFHPTYRGLIAAMEEAGCSQIVEVHGICAEPIELYSDQLRRCLIGIK